MVVVECKDWSNYCCLSLCNQYLDHEISVQWILEIGRLQYYLLVPTVCGSWGICTVNSKDWSDFSLLCLCKQSVDPQKSVQWIAKTDQTTVFFICTDSLNLIKNLHSEKRKLIRLQSFLFMPKVYGYGGMCTENSKDMSGYSFFCFCQLRNLYSELRRQVRLQSSLFASRNCTVNRHGSG